MGPDWSLLPPELLLVISEKVFLIADYIRFRAVCHPWRSASSPQPHHLPVQAPWLMLPYQSKGNNDSTRLFYDLATSKTYRLDLPGTSEIQICGCSHGWLVLDDGKRTTSLLNPITQTTISLPSYTEPSSLFGIDQVINRDNFFLDWDQTHHFSIRKAILTSSPLIPNCFVFVFNNEFSCLAFCKIGDNRWTVIDILEDLPWGCNISDFTYCNGFLYTVNHFGNVTIYNLNRPSRRVMLSQCISINLMNLVQGVSGDILLIENCGREYEDGVPLQETEHKVYKLSNNEEPQWIEVKDLGENILFMGAVDHGISLSSADLQLPKGGANCLFYDSVMRVELYLEKGFASYNHSIKLGRLDDRTVTDIASDFGVFQNTSHGQKSFWLTPSFL